MEEISLKTPAQIALMVKGGKKLAQIRDLLVSKVKPGVKTIELDQLAEAEILTFGGQPSFKTVRDYKYTTCISINDEVVHGIPSARAIQLGDVVKIDLGMIFGSLHTDTTETVQVKSQKEMEIEKFLLVGEKTLKEAIKMAKAGNRIGQISQVIEENITQAGYSPVRVLTGHGVGKCLHEEPAIPQILQGRIEDTPEIVPGMTLAIEVIYNQGSSEIVLRKDGWTIATADGKISATFEKSIAVEKDGTFVLTP